MNQANSYQSKRVAEWTCADVAKWASDYNLLCNDYGLSKLRDHHITGEILSSFDESAMTSSGLSAEEARKISVAAAKYMIDSTDELSPAIIKTNVQATLARIKTVIENSKTIEYQKATVSPLAVNCLPLANDGLYWDTDYFDDVKQTEFYKNFAFKIRNSTSTEQNAKLHHLIQMSGTGKTHLMKQYIRQEGGVFVSFIGRVHGQFLRAVEEAISNVMTNTPYILSSQVGTFKQEQKFTEFAKMALESIPLSFVEYAKYFYDYEIGMNTEDQKEAFLRASLDGGQPAIFALHKRNLKLMQEKPTQYNSLRTDIIKYAKEQMMTFAYDEVHQMSGTFVGQFLHSATIVKDGTQVFQLTDGTVVSETELQAFLHERLRRERQKNYIQVSPGDFQRPTSLLYILVLVMENFTKETIPQMTASTVFSSTIYSHTGELYSRDRLPVVPIVVPPINDTATRFLNIIKHAFGPTAEAHIKQHHQQTLKNLSSRAMYLFDIFRANLLSHTKLDECLDAMMKIGEETAAQYAAVYLKSALLRPELKRVIANTIMKVNLGGHLAELEVSEVESLVSSGVLQLPEEYAAGTKFIVVQDHYDIYMRRTMHGYSLENLIQQTPALIRENFSSDIGTLGEYACDLLLKLCAQKYGRISQLSFVAELNLASTCAHKFVLSPALYCKRWGDTAGAWGIFEDYNAYKDALLHPNPAAGPDAICVLLSVDEKKPGGFLVLQSKQHANSLNEDDLVVALKSVNPALMFTSASEQRQKFEAALNKLPTEFVWIRAVYARSFTKQAWDDICNYNRTPDGLQFPILLLTARNLPAVLQATHFFKPKNSRGTPDKPVKPVKGRMAPKGFKLTELSVEEQNRLVSTYGFN